MPRPSNISRIAAIETDVEAIARRIAVMERRLDECVEAFERIHRRIDSLVTRQKRDEAWIEAADGSLDAAWNAINAANDGEKLATMAAEIERELNIE
jgi:predicted  nucleic acid-binding Zn-ribbon protein